jgi:hypothetical protein
VNDTPIVTRADSLEELALRINTEFAVAEAGQRQAIVAYRSIGQSLIEAKAKCGGHGKWLPWLKANVPFSERHARRYIALAKSDVTSDLEDAWRTILGNDEPEDETQPVVESEPTPDSDESEPDEDEADADDTPTDTVANSDTPTDLEPRTSDWCDQSIEQFRDAIAHLQKARGLFDEILRTPGGYFLHDVKIGDDNPLFTLQMADCTGRAGRIQKKLWLCHGLEVLLSAANRVRPVRVCAACQGKGCGACLDSGFVPADKQLLETYSQESLNFGKPVVPWEESK